MSDEKPNPLTDVRKGLGLLLRAARTAASKLPSKNLEEAVLTGAREVGRAFENVATTVERELFGKKPPPGASDPSSSSPSPGASSAGPPKRGEREDPPPGNGAGLA
jgi:hypothetical protein